MPRTGNYCNRCGTFSDYFLNYTIGLIYLEELSNSCVDRPQTGFWYDNEEKKEGACAILSSSTHQFMSIGDIGVGTIGSMVFTWNMHTRIVCTHPVNFIFCGLKY